MSREDIVDPKAIFKFLKSKKIHSYCLDIYNTNLNKDYKNLIKHKNVIITPHIGSRTYESVQRQGLMAVENLIKNI